MNINDFTVGDLTAAINKFPPQWGLINKSGIFRNEGIKSNVAIIEERSGTLALLPDHEWGGTGTVASADTRRTYTFHIKQTVHEDVVMPADVQGVRAFGSKDQMETISGVVARRLQRMRARHDITLEWKRMGALKGVVLSGDGTVLADLYATFGITQVSVDFDLGTATTNILAKCATVIDQITDNIGDDVMTGVTALVSANFYDKFVNHPKVIDAFRYHSEAAARLGSDMRAGFPFGGINFIEYRAAVAGTPFITPGDGHAFPTGTTNTFSTYFAPADFNETINTIGLQFYAKTWPRDGDRGVVIHTQSNSLPICKRPAALVRLFSST